MATAIGGSMKLALCLSIFALSISVSSFAAKPLAAKEGPCANFAKSGAIRAYKKQTGVVQGSPGISYSAKLVKTLGAISDYVVSISDSNEDNENWVIDYSVKVQDLGSNLCKILLVKQLGDARSL
jgi:hypothetical protein